MAQVKAALDSNWDVTVIAKWLDPSLIGRVKWLKLYVPPRGFAVKWLTGRFFIKRALGKRQFDIIHGHQPQIADLCDVYHCHFLTRAAYEANCLEDKKGLKKAIEWLQNRMVLLAEDYFYSRWNQATLMLFNSGLTRQSFADYYGMPEREEIFLCPASPVRSLSLEDRREARKNLLNSDYNGIVIGFLGGLHERKGIRRVIEALRGQRDMFLLIGGMYSEGYLAPGLEEHSRSVGLVSDVHEFYAACDVFVIASYFEPFGLVALEAAAYGVPIIATPEVGALPHLLAAQAGSQWDPARDRLRDVILRVIDRKDAFQRAAIRWADSLSAEEHGNALIQVYARVLKDKEMRIRDITR